MLTLDRILVPTDFSEGARAAYPFALAFARKYGGKIDLLHVIPSFTYLQDSVNRMGLPIDMDHDLFPHLIRDAENRLKRESETYFDATLRGTETVRVDFKPSTCIAETAAKSGADLVVMGASGSTAENVIRKSSVPVLSVPQDSVPGSVNRILVPTDYSDLSMHGLRGALSMADSLEAELILFHVVELYGSLSENEPRPVGIDELSGIRTNLAGRLTQWTEKHADLRISLEQADGGWVLVQHRVGGMRRVPIRFEVVKAVSAHYAILEAANELADMVVMTTHGRSGWSHLFLGSTTERVVRASEKPVLTWRPSKS